MASGKVVSFRIHCSKAAIATHSAGVNVRTSAFAGARLLSSAASLASRPGRHAFPPVNRTLDQRRGRKWEGEREMACKKMGENRKKRKEAVGV